MYLISGDFFKPFSFLRLADAEYKVCLCKADWCNSGNSVNPYQLELVLSVSLLYYQI